MPKFRAGCLKSTVTAFSSFYEKTFRYLLLFRGFFVAFSWPSSVKKKKQCSGLFRCFFVVFSWLFRGPRFGLILPKGPSRTKNTTDSTFTIRSKFATAIVKHYGRHFENTFFKGKLSSKSLQIVKHYGIERRSVFSTEGSFGYAYSPWNSLLEFLRDREDRPSKIRTNARLVSSI